MNKNIKIPPVKFQATSVPSCIINHGDMPRTKMELSNYRTTNQENPYRDLHETDTSSWEFKIVKYSSNMRGCKDIDASITKYKSICISHVDTNYGYVASTPNAWITFRIPERKSGKLRISSGILSNKVGATATGTRSNGQPTGQFSFP